MKRLLRFVLTFSFTLLGLSLLITLPTSTVRAEAGTDWAAQFYNNTTLADPAVATGVLYPTGLNFTWAGQPQDGFGTTLTGVAADGWSARYVTTENFTAGSYEFVLTGDDGFRLYIDGNLIGDYFTLTGLNTRSVVVPFGSDGIRTIVVEHVDISGSASIQVNWFPSTDTAEPTATPIPQAFGQVERVNGLAVRTGPFLGASLINVARPGKQYEISARNIQEGVYTWFLIKIDETQSGWVSGRYLALTQGDQNTLPFGESVFDSIGVPPRCRRDRCNALGDEFPTFADSTFRAHWTDALGRGSDNFGTYHPSRARPLVFGAL
jgi:hypothetical protein